MNGYELFLSNDLPNRHSFGVYKDRPKISRLPYKTQVYTKLKTRLKSMYEVISKLTNEVTLDRIP